MKPTEKQIRELKNRLSRDHRITISDAVASAALERALQVHFLPPIERDEAFDRTYIPLPGGWEIQTKGKGSSFRICNTKTGERLNIPDSPYLHETLTEMALEVHKAVKNSIKSAT